jgi:hypothetical protein
MRLVGYPRVSTRGQVKMGASIPYPEREIRTWARHNATTSSACSRRKAAAAPLTWRIGSR